MLRSCPTSAKRMGNERIAGISERVVVPDYQVCPLPESVSDIQGALVEPAAVAAYGVDRTGFHAGETILVTGAGPIGALAALYAHAGGAARVIISEPNAKRRALAEAFGIATVLDPLTDDVPEAVRQMTGGTGVDVAALPRPDQLAYWINLYNVSVVGIVVDNYPVESIRDLSTDPIIRINVFKKPSVAVKGGKMSLNDIENDKVVQRKVLEKVQTLENAGYQFEAAEASFELLLRKEIGRHREFFTLDHYRVIVLKMSGTNPIAKAVQAKAIELLEQERQNAA